MPLDNGERQVAPTLSGIRRDHVARYEWAARCIGSEARVLDMACGIGYGAAILAAAGNRVEAVDRCEEAIEYGRQHYLRPRISFDVAACESDLSPMGRFDAACVFETIEHLENPLPFLRSLPADKLYASVPNEAVFPHEGRIKFHYRHYTRAQFSALLAAAGWEVTAWYGQRGPHSEVERGVKGRTLVAVAVRKQTTGDVELEPLRDDRMSAPQSDGAAPAHVAIVGLGPSSKAYFDMAMRLGGRRAWADEVWAINALGDVLACDRVFHMDDLWVQERRAAADPDGNIARMVDWLRGHPGPIYTSAIRPGYRGLVEYPLEDVLNNGGVPYLNNTAAYAIAYARHIGVKKISLYGVDFTRPNIHQGEQGRACCEFWLGLCTASGMEVVLPAETTLMDACAPEGELFYGYDGFEVVLRNEDGGHLGVDLRPRELPTAAEVERRYDHSRHPNRLMRGEDP